MNSNYELGYREVSLMHAGETTGFKKIIRLRPEERDDDLPFDTELNGEFVHIATESYVLLPNERVKEVVEQVVGELKSSLHTPRFFKPGKWQYVAHYTIETEDVLTDEKDAVGFLITNSMNGTLATDVRAFAMLGDIGLVKESVYKHKHTANLVVDPTKLKELVERATRAATEDLRRVLALKDQSPQDWLEVMEALPSKLPEKYLPAYLNKKVLGGSLYPDLYPASMWDVFVEICHEIWMSTSSEATKIELFDKLNAGFSKVIMVKRMVS